jgi:14-3-3 protein epsilon
MCKLKIKMHSSEFWARVYDLPLKLRSDAMAKLLGNVIGNFVDVDAKDVNRLGKFLRVKVTFDLRQPLKWGTIVKYQSKNHRVYFKYERLPTFCYACWKIGHQIKDCDTVEGEDDADFEDIEEKDLPFGPWLRASPLPKLSGEVKKEQSSSSCSKSLFAEGSSSKGLIPESKGKEIEVVQPGTELGDQGVPVDVTSRLLNNLINFN